jgi:prepilin-type N-terminal cleavage/methylation domain-containing protein
MKHFPSPLLRRSRGFSLIEILVVIALIGILAGIITAALNSTRDKGKRAKAQTELRHVRNGVLLLEFDTGKWPNGCTPGAIGATMEVDLDSTNAGLLSFPAGAEFGTVTTDAVANPDCEWDQQDFALWTGPYTQFGNDPWGNAYQFDPDYYVYDDGRSTCRPTGSDNNVKKAVIVSAGADGILGTSQGSYDCNDVVYLLYEGTLAEW